ncbi:MAG: hypothetical protein JWM57_78 [Phycisphaerales bacterium]|nr:hypothetical protein [Phycisphaerales bacterium]
MARTTAKSSAGSSTKTTAPPIHTIRYRNIRASIWKNEGQSGPFYSVTFDRSYQDDQNNWKNVTSFNANDLPLLGKLANDSHSWIEWHQRKEIEDAKRA